MAAACPWEGTRLNVPMGLVCVYTGVVYSVNGKTLNSMLSSHFVAGPRLKLRAPVLGNPSCARTPGSQQLQVIRPQMASDDEINNVVSRALARAVASCRPAGHNEISRKVVVTLKLDEAEHRIYVIGKKASLIFWSFTLSPLV